MFLRIRRVQEAPGLSSYRALAASARVEEEEKVLGFLESPKPHSVCA